MKVALQSNLSEKDSPCLDTRRDHEKRGKKARSKIMMINMSKGHETFRTLKPHL